METPEGKEQKPKKGRAEGQPKRKGRGRADVSTTWANMQPRKVSEQLTRIAEAKIEAKELTKTKLGELAGYTDHSQASRILKGGPGQDDHGMVRIANALGCELLVVPTGTEGSVLGRLHDADERELRVLAGVLDLLLDFRGDPLVIEHFERMIPWLRAGAEQRRALTTSSAT